MDYLIRSIEKTLPKIVEEWNKIKLPLFEQLVEQSFKDYFANRNTQEKTKMVAPILDSIFARHLHGQIPEFVVAEGKGQDYMYGSTPIESKITFGAGDSWTGNGYVKTSLHLLMRFEIIEDGMLTRYFAMLADLDKCISKWTDPGLTSNFSTLKFKSQDKDNLLVIAGKVSTLTPTGKDATYASFVLTEMNN